MHDNMGTYKLTKTDAKKWAAIERVLREDRVLMSAVGGTSLPEKKSRKARVRSALGTGAVAALLVGAAIGAIHYTADPGYDRAHQEVLESTALLRQLGLCATLLDASAQNAYSHDHLVKNRELLTAAALARNEEDSIPCTPAPDNDGTVTVKVYNTPSVVHRQDFLAPNMPTTLPSPFPSPTQS